MFNEVLAQVRMLLAEGVAKWFELKRLIRDMPEGNERSMVEEYICLHTEAWPISWNGELRDLHDAKLVYIPCGKFKFGTTKAFERGLIGALRQAREVVLTRDYYLFDAPITQAQYITLMGKNPSQFHGMPDRPVEMVSWHEAVECCNALSLKFGRPCVYERGIDNNQNITWDALPAFRHGGFYDAKGFRLPTEAEWERACKDGSDSERYDEPEKISWCYMGNGSLTSTVEMHSCTFPVKQKKANKFGCYDMLGNVWEWCADYFTVDDPSNEHSQFHRGLNPFRDSLWEHSRRLSRCVLKGGDYSTLVQSVYASCIGSAYGNTISCKVGFRPCISA